MFVKNKRKRNKSRKTKISKESTPNAENGGGDRHRCCRTKPDEPHTQHTHLECNRVMTLVGEEQERQEKKEGKEWKIMWEKEQRAEGEKWWEVITRTMKEAIRLDEMSTWAGMKKGRQRWWNPWWNKCKKNDHNKLKNEWSESKSKIETNERIAKLKAVVLMCVCINSGPSKFYLEIGKGEEEWRAEVKQTADRIWRVKEQNGG